jgi:hypothetical protein
LSIPEVFLGYLVAMMEMNPRAKVLLAVKGAFAHAGRLWGAGGVGRRPRRQRQRFAVSITFTASGDTGIREHSVATFVDLNPTSTVRVEAVQLGDHGGSTLIDTALNVVDRISANIPGASNGFWSDGSICFPDGTTPQISGHCGVLGSASVELIAFLEQGQIVDSLTIVDASNRLSLGATTAIGFTEIESISTVEHRAHIVGLTIHLALLPDGNTDHQWN